MARSRKVEETQEQMAQAQQEAAEAGTGLAATVTRDVPRMRVRVLADQEVKADDTLYTEGDTLELDGPTAIALLQMGHVEVEGTA